MADADCKSTSVQHTLQVVATLMKYYSGYRPNILRDFCLDI